MKKIIFLIATLSLISLSDSFAAPIPTSNSDGTNVIQIPPSSFIISHFLNDSISVREIIKWRAEKLTSALSIDLDDQSRYYFKQFKRKLKKATKKHSFYSEKKISKTYLVNEIKNSDYHIQYYKDEESRKKMWIALGVVVAGILLLKMKQTIENSN